MDQAEKERQDEVIVGFMCIVDKVVKAYVRKFPVYRYLRDDFVAEGYANLTHLVRRRPSDTHTEAYVYRTSMNAIQKVIRDDDTVVYPKTYAKNKKMQRVSINDISESEISYETQSDPVEYLKLPTHRLTENQIEILELIRKGLSFNAAAEVLSVEPGTARKRHQRAIERLREYYEDSTSDILFSEE